MTGPLQGVRVLELTGLGPGPHGGMILADLGADVIRVERPGAPTLPHMDPQLRGRRIVELDVKQSSDLDVLWQLISQADVLIEGFRPGVMERLGLGPELCLERNPRLIYTRMTGWGQTGPLAHTAGHDINYIALTGALHAIGRRTERPVPPLNLIGDYGGGSMFMVLGVTTALFERERSGLGQVIDVAMIDGTSVLIQNFWGMRARGIWQDDRESNLLDGATPYYDTYECSDGKWVAVGAIEPQFYSTMLSGLELDPVNVPDRENRDNWPALRCVLAEAFRRRTRDEWTKVFEHTDACVTPVLAFHEVENHMQIAARKSVHSVDGVTQAGTAPVFSRTNPTELTHASVVSAPEIATEWAAVSHDAG